MLIPDVAAATDRLVELVENRQRKIAESWEALDDLADALNDEDDDPNSLLAWDRIIRANAQR